MGLALSLQVLVCLLTSSAQDSRHDRAPASLSGFICLPFRPLALSS